MNPFKKGDIVVCTTKISSIYSDSKKYLNTAGIKVGDKVKILVITNNGCGDRDYLSFEDKSYVHPYDCFRLEGDVINYEIY